MTNDELMQLKALAEAATPGPWMWHQSSTPFREAGGEIVGDDPLPYGDLYTAYETIGFNADGERITESITIAEEVGIDNLRYLGQVSPDKILALIAKVESLAAPSAANGAEMPKSLHQIDIYHNNGQVTSVDGYTTEQLREAILTEREQIARAVEHFTMAEKLTRMTMANPVSHSVNLVGTIAAAIRART